MTHKYVIGIDPGKNGAAALFKVTPEDIFLQKVFCFKHDKDWRRNLFNSCQFEKPDRAYLEDVHSMPTDGKVGSFSFGRRLGEADTVLYLAKIDTKLVTPQAWQAALGLLRKEKKRQKELALKLYPNCASCEKKSECDVYAGVLIGFVGSLDIQSKTMEAFEQPTSVPNMDIPDILSGTS